MKNLIAIIITLQLAGVVWSKAGVEIQQQRLIRVPQNFPSYQATEQTPETERILNEIQKINVQFGYIKNEPQISPRVDDKSYFYPRPSYYPIHQRYNNGVALSPTIRHLNILQRSEKMYPFSVQTFFYPTPYLQLPFSESAKLFQRTDKSEKMELSPKDLPFENGDNVLIRSMEYAPQYAKIRHNTGQAKLIRDYNQEKALIQTVKNIVNEIKLNNKPLQTEIADVINEITGESRSSHKIKKQPLNGIYAKSPLDKKNKTRTEDGGVEEFTTNLDAEASARTTPSPTTINSKTFFYRPKPSKVEVNLKTTEKPHANIRKDAQQETLIESESPPALFKGPFSEFFKGQKEQVVEALREGGIIIQRLKVREGGIAIAGPGGVATAGSGGTAIVGPGGIALTHPRSLAIAGPGAKVIAVPESVDLEKLALRSNARQLPIEGVVVATGPVIYYNDPAPAT